MKYCLMPPSRASQALVNRNTGESFSLNKKIFKYTVIRDMYVHKLSKTDVPDKMPRANEAFSHGGIAIKVPPKLTRRKSCYGVRVGNSD